MGPQLGAIRRQSCAGGEPGEHRSQIAGVDVAVEAECPAGGADPSSGSFTGAGVILVQPRCDLGEVVGLDPHAQLPQRQHSTRFMPPRSGARHGYGHLLVHVSRE
jgi:hypothetical protein